MESLSADNPSELTPAVVFAVAAVQDSFGDRGLYVVAAVSGLTDLERSRYQPPG